MPTTPKNVLPGDAAIVETRSTLARRIAAGKHFTAIPEFVLYARDEPAPCYRASYEPSLSIFRHI